MYVVGRPRRFLQVEGAVLFGAMLFLFNSTHQNWWLVLVLLFLPDLFMAGYAGSSKLGALLYNIGHTYLLPTMLVLYGVHNHRPFILGIGLIWLAHIGMDRVLGYGLKYDDNFKHTHLGNLSKV